MYKYNPDDFSECIAQDMRRVYELYEHRDTEDNAVMLIYAVDELYYFLRDLRTYKIMPPERVVEMQNYFRSLLYD